MQSFEECGADQKSWTKCKDFFREVRGEALTFFFGETGRCGRPQEGQLQRLPQCINILFSERLPVVYTNTSINIKNQLPSKASAFKNLIRRSAVFHTRSLMHWRLRMGSYLWHRPQFALLLTSKAFSPLWQCPQKRPLVILLMSILSSSLAIWNVWL